MNRGTDRDRARESLIRRLETERFFSPFLPAAVLPQAPVEAPAPTERPITTVSKVDAGRRAEALAEQAELAAACTSCRLARGRTKVVFGSGDPNADLMFVGEAPGREEDLQGLPFVGRSGRLLTRLLAEVGLRREDIYIANVVKCRPPENRTPEPAEVTACAAFLRRQIDLVDPRMICALGRPAAALLLSDSVSSMGLLRGNFREVRGRLVGATYHPAYLLRNPAETVKVRADLRKIVEKLEEFA